jgi:hypothetical protein
MLRNFSVAALLAASEEGLSSTELVNFKPDKQLDNLGILV